MKHTIPNLLLLRAKAFEINYKHNVIILLADNKVHYFTFSGNNISCRNKIKKVEKNEVSLKWLTSERSKRLRTNKNVIIRALNAFFSTDTDLFAFHDKDDFIAYCATFRANRKSLHEIVLNHRNHTVRSIVAVRYGGYGKKYMYDDDASIQAKVLAFDKTLHHIAVQDIDRLGMRAQLIIIDKSPEFKHHFKDSKLKTVKKYLEFLDNGYKSQYAIVAERIIKYTKRNMYIPLAYEPIQEDNMKALKKYSVRVETRVVTSELGEVEVEASSEEEAVQKAIELYESDDIEVDFRNSDYRESELWLETMRDWEVKQI